MSDQPEPPAEPNPKIGILNYAGGRELPTPDAIAPDESFTVVDDEVPDAEPAIEWASNQLVDGSPFEKVSADLQAQGWSLPAAEKIVEAARQQTRASRGVVTRDAVANGAERRYRQTFANMRWIVFGGLPAFIVGVRNLIISFKGIWGSSGKSPTKEAASEEQTTKPK